MQILNMVIVFVISFVIGLSIFFFVKSYEEKPLKSLESEELADNLAGLAKGIQMDYPATSAILFMVAGSLVASNHEEETEQIFLYLIPFAEQKLKELKMRERGIYYELIF